jgi:hypothetical protein
LNVAFGDVEVYYLGVIEKYMTSMGVFRDQFKEMGHPDLKKMKNFGGNMKHFSLLFILVFAVAAFGQEAMEASAEDTMVADTAAVDTMTMDDMLMADTTAVEEAVVEEDAGDALEAMLAEEGTMETEVTSGSAIIGYTAGLMTGYPIGLGSLGNYDVIPNFGVVVGTPFGFALGPFEMGLGAEISYYDFIDKSSGVGVLATVNTAIIETAQGPVALELGAGWYGLGPGGVAGLTYSYALPGIPLVLKPFVRANLTYDSELAKIDGNDGLHIWVTPGIYLSYDISTLF